MANTASLGAEHGFARVALPKRFCNLERLLFALRARGLDGIVATLPYNVFYLTGLQCHRPQGRRAAPLRGHPVAPCARPADPGDRRLLPGDVPEAADLGGGHPPVPRRHDAARSAAEARPTSIASFRRRRRRPLGRALAPQLRLRHGQRPCAAPCKTSSSIAAASPSTTWGQASGSAWKGCRSPTATIL